MLLWWTKRSFEPSSGVMKPKPFSSLNHLTVPVAMFFLHGVFRAASAVGAQGNLVRAPALLSPDGCCPPGPTARTVPQGGEELQSGSRPRPGGADVQLVRSRAMAKHDAAVIG